MQWILFLESERWEADFWRRSMCSEKPPWRARTPTVRLIMMELFFEVSLSPGCRDVLEDCYASKDDKSRYER